MTPDLVVDFGIILAAGGSTRMGSPKALLPWQGDALVNAHIRAFEPVCRSVIVVTGKHHAEICARIKASAIIVRNEEWATTQMADSLRMAIHNREGTALGTPVDCEPIPQDIVSVLCEMGAPAVPQYDGEDGHPALIRIPDVRASTGHLQSILANARRVPVHWSGTLATWNTPEQWQAHSTSGESARS